MKFVGDEEPLPRFISARRFALLPSATQSSRPNSDFAEKYNFPSMFVRCFGSSPAPEIRVGLPKVLVMLHNFLPFLSFAVK